MLGVVIGVTSVIILTSLGEGAKDQVSKQIQGLGSNLLMVTPGRLGWGGRGRGASGSANVLTTALMETIRAGMTTLDGVAGETSGSKTVVYGKNSFTTRIVGVSPDYWEVRNIQLVAGQYFRDRDYQGKRRVAIITPYIAEELFGTENPIGEEIRIDNFRFRVVGVTEAKGQEGMNNVDDRIYIPLETALYRVFGDRYLRTIYLKVKEDVDMDLAEEEAMAVIGEKVKNQDLYEIRNQADILNTAQSATATFTLLLAGIASVSLLVGGIGIMNIMLVSVTERIKEIGIRKAIGASKRDILLQFLLEAIALSTFGGLIGILLGFVGGIGLSMTLGLPTKLAPGSVFVAFLFSVAVGLFFGVYPAKKAAEMHPIDALRYE